MMDAVSSLPSSVASAATVDRLGTTAVRPGSAGGDVEAGADFGTIVSQLTSQAAGVVRNAENVSIAGIQGRATVQQVVEAVMTAEHTLQGAVAIRDKVVAAYLELSRMQI